jgi:Tfp pilus assembly protein PilW
MERHSEGFSLLELLVAAALTSVVAAVMFQLFGQGARLIHDQNLIMEMQQTARIVASQIADELRMAGQAMPVYAAALDLTPSEALAVFLSTSNASRVDFRVAISNVETSPASSAPVDFTLGTSRTLTVKSTAGFSAGQFAYLTGIGSGAGWKWVRAQVMSAGSGAMTLLARQSSNGNATTHFASAPDIALEEAVSIQFNAGSVRRATAADFSVPGTPAWSAANEIGRYVKRLAFTYYDSAGHPIQPDTLEHRMAIARVDVELTVETAGPLSDGTRPAYSLRFRTTPRNLKLRPSPM